MIRIFLIAVVSLTGVCTRAADRPNVLLIMPDDLGFADLGCYGGEIETPTLDELASKGTQFTRFRATPMCATSRIAMLAGMQMHRAGGEDYKHSVPLPMLLKRSGYRTLMTGKWHAGKPDPRSRRLFDRSFGFLGGMTDCYAGGPDWFLDEQPFKDFDDGFYATHAIADQSIEMMHEADAAAAPFFMYVAFNAPHHPCQAPKATVEKYRDVYRAGYAAIREQRIRRQTELGLVSPSTRPAELAAEVRSWNELTPHRRGVEADRMAAYAAAVDEVDQAIGKIVRFLLTSGLEDSTYIVFLSDNGGDYNNGSLAGDERQVPWKPGGNPSSSNGWASVKCAPFRYYKHACHEGGLATPLLIVPPSGKRSQDPNADAFVPRVIDDPVEITDLFPTICDWTQTAYPETFSGRPIRKLSGRSLTPLLKPGGRIEPRTSFQWYHFSRAWIEDEWKAVQLYGGPWQLFDLRNDRGETNDLAGNHPDRLVSWIKKWHAFAESSDVPDDTVNVPLDRQAGWGWHRLQMVCPALTSVSPGNGDNNVEWHGSLQLKFNFPVDFAKTTGKRISLYEVSDESTPVWQADPDESHVSQGKTEILFDNLPPLKPDCHYFLLWDHGWAFVNERPIGGLNDGAYWWRFRTSPLSNGAN